MPALFGCYTAFGNAFQLDRSRCLLWNDCLSMQDVSIFYPKNVNPHAPENKADATFLGVKNLTSLC
jgi:hypothetical protein